MDRRIVRSLFSGLFVGCAFLPGISRGAPLVYIQLLARPDGTDQPFSSSITPTAVGQEFDWIVVATLAPAGTVNTNLPVDANGKQQIGSWQAGTGATTTNDGLGGVQYALFQSPADSTQVSFQNIGYLGARGNNSIDQNIFNGVTTTSGTGNDAIIGGNASFAGGVNTATYAYSVSGNIQSPSVTLKPTGVSQSASGYALFQNFGQGTGAVGGIPVARSGRNANNDLTYNFALAGLGLSYLGIDPAIANVSGTNQSPISVILDSGSNAGGTTYNNGGGDRNGNDSAFIVTSLHSGSSMVSINAFDTNPGNPGGALTAFDGLLNIQYHDTAGALVRPGVSGVFQYSSQTGPDPIIQFTGLTMVGSGSPGAEYTTQFTFTNGDGTGSWSSPSNWTAGGPPFLVGDTAIFDSTSPTGVVALDGNVSVGAIQFNNGASGSGMTISASGPAGVLTMDNRGVITTATISVAAGQHVISAPVALNGPLSVSVSTTASGTGLTISGPIYDGENGIQDKMSGGSNYNLSLDGGGTLTLSGANTYTGATNINGGTLKAGAANSIPSSSAVTVAPGATLLLNGFNQSIGSLSGAGSITNNSSMNVTLAVGNSGQGATAIPFSGVISNTTDGSTGTVSLANVGGGTLILTGSNTYSGGTFITNGTLNIAADSALGAVPPNPTTNVSFNGNYFTSTLQFNTNYVGTSLSMNRSIVVSSYHYGGVDTNGNPVITYGGLVTVDDSGTFRKAGAGSFEIQAPPTLYNYSVLSVIGGSLRLNYGVAATIGLDVSATVSNGATLELAGSTSQLSQSVYVANAGTLLVSSSANQNVGNLVGSDPARFEGSTIVNSGASLTANQIIQNAVTNTGAITINPNESTTPSTIGTLKRGTQVAPQGSTTIGESDDLTANQIVQNSLTIKSGATVTLSPSGSGSTKNPTGPNNASLCSIVGSLSISGSANNYWTATLDIGNNGLVVQYGSGADPYSAIVGMVASGYANGQWTGAGITSSLARASAALGSSTPALNIGVVDFVPNSPGFGSSILFEGQTITTSAVLVRLTYMDDLLLTGDLIQQNVTNDAITFGGNYGSGTAWSVGDLNHDGRINSSDALLFAANFVTGLPSLDGTISNSAAAGSASGFATVPEPPAMESLAAGAILLCGWPVIRRRRQRSASNLSNRASCR